MKNHPLDTAHCYDDIIHLPHHVSATHPHMPVSERAAQFSPFAALTGHQEALREAARLTEEKIELDENARNILDQKLQLLLAKAPELPTAAITYFQPDLRKAGGSYKTATGIIKSVNPHKRTVVMEDHLEIPADDIVSIDGTIIPPLS